MKRSKLLLVLVLALVAVMALVACDKTPVHEHAYGGWTIETAPTASAEGTATRKCACGEKETATLASLSDTSVWTVSNNVPATHTQDGCTVYTSQYGTVVVTLGKLTDHKYGAWEITVEPDLTTAGKAKRTCECGDIDEVDVPALENAVWTAAPVVRASHDEEGLVRYTSVYGTVEKTVAKGEHSWSSWKIVTAPTATVKGEAARFCTTNGCKSTETAELPVLTDTTVWTASVTAATCTTPEITAYTSVYGTVTVETAAANGHKFQVSAIVTEPTCTEKGSATIKCTVCDCEETKEIAALGHDFSGAFVPYIASAMENEDGETWGTDYDGSEYHAQKCSRCGVYDDANKQPHTFNGAPVYKVSESSLGYHTANAYYTCDDCEYTKSEELTGYLEQTEYWTKGEETPADYNKEGKVIYTYKEDNTQITIVTPKLVAPYDGKTYTAADVDFKTEPDALSKCDKINAFINLDETGKGTGTAFPFKGDVSVTMVDSATGKIRFASDGNTYDGYVDMETGIIVYFGFFNKVYILSPFDSANSEYKASQFALSRAIEYTPDCNLGSKHSFTMFVTDDKVYFGVRFNNGTADISANECFEAENLVVFDKDGNKIKGFKKVDGTTTALDGYEGTYTNSADATESVVIDGIGGLVINGTVNGVYTKAADADYFEVYIVDESGVKVEYYQVTLSGNSYTKVKPMTNVHFVSSEGTAPTITEYNTNIAQTLPTMADVETKVFRGWKIAEDGETIYTYTPDGTEVTFTAIWANKVSVTLVGVLEGDPTSVVMGEGDNIVSKLPAYKGYETVSADGKKFFVAWKVGENIIEEETIADAGLNGQTITAIWQDIPAYVGTYKGANTYGNNSVLSRDDVTIKINGQITGRYTGQITDYDKNNQLITFTYKNNTYYLRYDELSGVLIGGDGTTSCKLTLGGDFDTYGIDKPSAYYRLYAGQSSSAALVRFITINTKYCENDNILFYNDHIYSNISITDAFGNALTTASIKDAKTIVVKDLSTGTIVFKAAAKDATFGVNNYSQELDEMFGTYTCEGKDNIVLDGVGGFKMGSKYGTYAVKDAEANTYEAYVLVNGVKTEYHILTINVAAKTYTIETPSVSVTLVSDKGTVESPVQANLNVAFNFPSPNVEGFILKGWYLQSDETKTIVKEYIPKETDTCTFVALWAEKVTLSIIYGNGVESKDVDFGKGDTLDMSAFVPEFTNGKVFDHWYLSDDNGATEKAVFSDTTITANTTVYCAWINKPYSMKDTSKYAKHKFTYKDGVWTSGNRYQDNTTSSFTITALGDITVTFSYLCSSEGWDKLTIKYGDSPTITKSGMSSYASFECTLKAGETIVITYTKDSSDYEDDDRVYIKDLKVNGSIVDKYDD